MVSLHSKNSRDSLCVTYRCGVRTFREWVCLDHDGYARRKAEEWWASRFPSDLSVPTVKDALLDLFLGKKIHDRTESITVVKDGKYDKIISYKLKELK